MKQTSCFLVANFYIYFVITKLSGNCVQVQSEESVILFLVVWTVTEISRYSYYTFNLLHQVPYFIKWARWSVCVWGKSFPTSGSSRDPVSVHIFDENCKNCKEIEMSCKDPPHDTTKPASYSYPRNDPKKGLEPQCRCVVVIVG